MGFADNCTASDSAFRRDEGEGAPLRTRAWASGSRDTEVGGWDESWHVR